MSARQRRGKKDAATGPLPPAAETEPSTYTSASTPEGTDDKPDAQEQLDRALLSMVATKEKTKELHGQWRDHLFRMCCIALLVCFHQLHGPLLECMTEIKDFNKELLDENDPNTVPGSQAILIVLNDSVCELLGIVLVSLTTYFTAMRDPPGDRTSWPYIAAHALVPLQLALFYQTKIRKGCIPDPAMEHLMDGNEAELKTRSFPLAVLLNLIISAAYWFMRHSLDKCDENIKMIEKLKLQLAEAKKKNEYTKKKVGALARAKADMERYKKSGKTLRISDL